MTDFSEAMRRVITGEEEVPEDEGARGSQNCAV